MLKSNTWHSVCVLSGVTHMFKLNRSGVGEVKCILGNVPVKGLSQSSPYLLIGYFVREGVHLRCSLGIRSK